MEWVYISAFYIITGIAFLAIPTIVIYIKLKDKTNFNEFMRYFSTAFIYIIPFIVSLNGSAGINDKEILIATIIVLNIGLISGIVYYFIIKKSLNNNPQTLSFINSLGITSGYAFYFYIYYGVFLFLLKNIMNKVDLPFKIQITLFEYPFVVYVIDLLLYVGHFFNILSETIILKYNLPKFYIILLIIFQSVLFPLHLAYTFAYFIELIIVIILISIIEIIFGIILDIKYEKAITDEKEKTSISETALNEINNDNNNIMPSF